MKKIFLFSMLAVMSLAASAQKVTTWKNDPAHSRLGFVVKHLMISEIEGYFSDFSTVVTTQSADYLDAKIKVTAKVASINTGVEMRDNHLKSADFFDAEKYPEMTFVSTKVVKKSKTDGLIYGDLTFHGVTKAVVLNATFYGMVENPMNKQQTAGFKVKGSISRKDFNLGAGYPEPFIGDKVEINVNLEFSPNN